MALKLVARIALLGVAFALSGCIAFGTLDRRATMVNAQVASVQNRAVLINLARASRQEPIYFVALSQINASGSADLKFGLPAVGFGPHQTVAQHIYTFGTNGTNVLDNQTTTSFQMSLLGSKDFYNGLMAPLDLRDVDLLLHQGYSRELVFYLVIEKAKITPENGEPRVVFNDPSRPDSFKDFEFYISQAMIHGLTTETYMAPGESAKSDGGKGDASKSDDAKKPSLTGHAELCYDGALNTDETKKNIPAESFCGAKPDVRSAAEAESGPLYVNIGGQRQRIDVTTRSIYGIFYYLGHLIANGHAVTLHDYHVPNETTEEAPLIDVRSGGGPCFTEIEYEERTYCAPMDADNTKRIFALLNALIALKQSPGDLPITQTVRIEP
jgi:hypothetical protein